MKKTPFFKLDRMTVLPTVRCLLRLVALLPKSSALASALIFAGGGQIPKQALQEFVRGADRTGRKVVIFCSETEDSRWEAERVERQLLALGVTAGGLLRIRLTSSSGKSIAPQPTSSIRRANAFYFAQGAARLARANLRRAVTKGILEGATLVANGDSASELAKWIGNGAVQGHSIRIIPDFYSDKSQVFALVRSALCSRMRISFGIPEGGSISIIGERFIASGVLPTPDYQSLVVGTAQNKLGIKIQIIRPGDAGKISSLVKAPSCSIARVAASSRLRCKISPNRSHPISLMGAT